MIGRNAFLALFAVLALALTPAAAAASTADSGASTVAAASKSKKKGKGKRKSCKGKKGKAKKKCLRNQKKNKGSGKLANGRYEDQRSGVGFKVTGRGSKIQLTRIDLLSLCVPQEAGSGNRVPLKSRKGSLVAEETFQVVGGGTLTVSWSTEIDPQSLRYSLEYDASYEIAGDAPVRCEGSDTLGGRLSH